MVNFLCVVGDNITETENFRIWGEYPIWKETCRGCFIRQTRRPVTSNPAVRKTTDGVLHSHPARAILRVSWAETAHEIDDEANQQDQAKPAAADDGAAKVKPAAAKQEKQNNHE